MTLEELIAAYSLAARPFREGVTPVPISALALKSWRYLIEVNSACNLRCAMCISGNREGYAYTPGIMDMALLERILDKVKSENPEAILCPYGSGEPFLHPQFAECVRAIKKRGLTCEVATNLQKTTNAEAILAASPDIIIVSTSGFTQDVYSRAHRGGDVETLKGNLAVLADIRSKINPALPVAVSYHRYRYNLDEIEPMKALAESLGFMFWSSHARTISMENTVQALRYLEFERTGTIAPYELEKDGQDWNTLLPPANQEFVKNMEQLQFHPQKAVELYAHWPVAPVCIIADLFTYIRHDGRVQLCAWTDDMRMTLGNYLDMSQQQIIEARWGRSFCKECLRYRLNLYYHILDSHTWEGAT